MNRIREFRTARGWSLQKLAESVGTNKSQIDKLEKGARRLTVDWMVRLAKPLGCDPREFLPHTPELPDKKTKALPFAKYTTAAGPNLIPVRGPDGKVVDHVPRPYFLAHAKGAYAVYMPDGTMAPMYRPKQLLFINPYKPASAGNGVVLVDKNNKMLVREFVKADAASVTVREYQPKLRNKVLSLRETIAVHVVGGTVES